VTHQTFQPFLNSEFLEFEKKEKDKNEKLKAEAEETTPAP
jgi:hypothetical protein